MGAGDKLTRQILGILYDGGHDQVGDAVGFVSPVVIFREDRIPAVGNAILAEIAGPQMRGDDFERSGARSRGSWWPAASAAPASRNFPKRDRITLQLRRCGNRRRGSQQAARLCGSEMEETGLRAGV